MPRRYACKACGLPTPNASSLCNRDECQQHRRRQRAANSARPDARARRNARPARAIYNTARWRTLAARIIARDEVCQVCLCESTDTDPLTCGHIVALAQGGDPWDETNLQAEHRTCNGRKGAR